MFAGASGVIFQRAQNLRKNMTDAEISLWEVLKSKKHFPYKFRRQHPYQNYILDFYSHKLKLVIEVDGDYHFIPEQIEKDNYRDESLEKDGLNVIRFTNEEVLKSIETCLMKIKEYINDYEKRANI